MVACKPDWNGRPLGFVARFTCTLMFWIYTPPVAHQVKTAKSYSEMVGVVMNSLFTHGPSRWFSFLLINTGGTLKIMETNAQMSFSEQ